METNGQPENEKVAEQGEPQSIEAWRSAAPARAVDFEDYEKLWGKLERYKKVYIKESDWQTFGTRSGKEGRHLKQPKIQGLFALAGLSMVARPQFTRNKNPLPEGEASKWAEPFENEVRCEIYAVNPFGQVFHGIGVMQGRECRRRDHSVQWEDQGLNRLERMAYKRALSHLVKNALGGVDWIGQDESDDEPTETRPVTSKTMASEAEVERIGRLAREKKVSLSLALRIHKANSVADLTQEQARRVIEALEG